MNATNAVIAAAVAVTFVALAFGVINMLRGGQPGRSQKLMRWRVGLQALAIALILAALWMGGVRPG